MSGFRIRLHGLERSREIPSEIEAGLVRFREELLPPLVEDFRRTEPEGGKWPKSPRRKTIQEQTKGLIRGETILIGTFHSRFARHLDTGGQVEPRKKTVMRFRNQAGEFVFTRKPIVHQPRPYFARVLSQVPEIVALVYERVFGSIGRG